MQVANKFSQSIWKKEDEKFKKLRIKVPDKELHKVDFVVLKKNFDFDRIPETGGCYWTWTNEPVKHRFHKHKTPDKIKDGEIIYNGIAKDNLQRRIKHHLLGQPRAGWSGISLDIYPGESRSHRKKALSSDGKVPYVNCVLNKRAYYDCQPVRKKELIFKLFLSTEEKDFIKKSNAKTFYLRNGINVFEKKHKRFTFKVYFIVGLEPLYLEYIEKKWREEFGLPKLCSYSSGR